MHAAASSKHSLRLDAIAELVVFRSAGPDHRDGAVLGARVERWKGSGMRRVIPNQSNENQNETEKKGGFETLQRIQVHTRYVDSTLPKLALNRPFANKHENGAFRALKKKRKGALREV